MLGQSHTDFTNPNFGVYYDANGQVMAVYDVTLGEDETATVDEHHIYGASRLGMRKSGTVLYDNGVIPPVTSQIYQNTLGLRNYEITNHLGNVNAVINDRKTYAGIGAASLYEAWVVVTSDYYPFGMLMPGRHNEYAPANADYRYAYNGMELDDEISGSGNSIDFGNRMYNPRLGRFLSLDAFASKYPSISPYAFVANNPISNIEMGGDSVLFYSSSGTFLGYSHDNKRYKDKNLLVIIDDKQVANFNKQYLKKTAGRKDNDKTNDVYTEAITAGLEAMGTTYDVTSMKTFFNKYHDQKTDENGKLYTERMTLNK